MGGGGGGGGIYAKIWHPVSCEYLLHKDNHGHVDYPALTY